MTKQEKYIKRQFYQDGEKIPPELVGRLEEGRISKAEFFRLASEKKGVGTHHASGQREGKLKRSKRQR